jgi:hypothetical protein
MLGVLQTQQVCTVLCLSVMQSGFEIDREHVSRLGEHNLSVICQILMTD